MTLRLSHGLSSLVDLYQVQLTKMNFTKTLLLCDDDIEVLVDVKSRGGERSSLAVNSTNLLYVYIHTIEGNDFVCLLTSCLFSIEGLSVHFFSCALIAKPCHLLKKLFPLSC